jgi:hypothetical protein
MDTPRVLLEHYLKQLRLPTVLREFPRLADQCAKEGATFVEIVTDDQYRGSSWASFGVGF